MNAIQCDKCKMTATVDHIRGAGHKFPDLWRSISVGVQWHDDKAKEYDLCPSCSTKLEEFLKTKPPTTVTGTVGEMCS